MLHFDEYGNCSETGANEVLGLVYAGASPLRLPREVCSMTPRPAREPSSHASATRDEAPQQPSRPSRSSTDYGTAGHSSRDQKLLSFTDNRQDAALQAGHFNDFVQVAFGCAPGFGRRSSLPRDGALDYATLGEAIFNSLVAAFPRIRQPRRGAGTCSRSRENMRKRSRITCSSGP